MMTEIIKVRLQYRLAWLLLLLLAFVAVFGSYLMPHAIDPSATVFRPETAPPSDTYWLGTEHRGYDLLSLLLNGAKYTLGFALAVTMVRFLLALPLGLFAGTANKARSAISTLQMMTTSVPGLVFIFPAMYGLSSVLPPEMITQVLFGLLVFIGTFQIADQFAERAHFLTDKEFVTASRSMGASKFRIAVRHLLPHLRPEIMFALITDFVQVLFLIGQLAVVGIFLGGGDQVQLDDGGATGNALFIHLSNTGEWGAMISYGIRYVRDYPWLIVSPAVFLSVSIMILSFFSKQIQKRFARPYLYQTKPLYRNKPILAFLGAFAAACIALVVLVPNKAPVPALATKTEAMKPTQDLQEITDTYTRGYMVETAHGFMQQLMDNRWSYATGYMASGGNSMIKPGETPKAPKPFDSWIQALTEQNYKYASTGKVWYRPDAAPPTYEVEVLITNPAGQEEIWTLIMLDKNQIVSGKGKKE